MNKVGGPSWTVVIIALVVFWPVGLFLLIRKLGSDRSAVMRRQTGSYVVGAILLLVALALLSDGSFAAALFFLVGGVLLFRRAGKAKRQGTSYRQYIDLVVNRQVTSLDTLAQMTGQSYDQVACDLSEMARQQYFPGAFVDHNTRQFVRPGAPQQYAYPQPGYPPRQQPVYNPMAGQQQRYAPQAPPPVAYQQPAPQPAAHQPQPQLRAVTCDGCGANNMVVGQGACEYCGSPL